MFKCFECGDKFNYTLEITETHGLDTPPYEKRYVCPRCKGSGYKPLVKDEISRREVLDDLVDIMKALNEFKYAVCDALSESTLNGTKFDDAHYRLFELIVTVAGDSEIELPQNIEDKIFDTKTSVQTAALFKILTENIEE